MKKTRYKRNSWLITFAVLLASASAAWSATEQVIYNFGSFRGDGSQPYVGLIRDAAGNIYGTTYVGGAFNAGTVFELSPVQGGGWNYAIIHSFAGGNDGGGPLGRLTLDTAGNLYGSTFAGGNGGTGNGIAFELSPSPGGNWTETVLHAFTGNGAGSTDGGFPEGGMVLDAAGNVYGTTDAGGSKGDGIVFELSPSPTGWTETVLHNFLGQADGANPFGSLAMDRQGRIYGDTFFGTVFRLTQNHTTKKWSFRTIFSFVNSNGNPNRDLIVDSHFHIFGTMSAGLPNAKGTIFELSKSAGVWTLNYLYGFSGGADGGFPIVGVTMDTASNLYGTTSMGGTNNLGVVYKLSNTGSKWTETVLHSFAGAPGDGAFPLYSEPALDAAGNLYGTTWQGGSNGGGGSGTVYEVTH
jgi:uncharacterized repeat protein (TIGR03803 family)